MATRTSHYPVLVDLATSLLDQGPAGIDLTPTGITVADDTDIVPTETHKVWVLTGASNLLATVAMDPTATFSFAAWVKRAALGASECIASYGNPPVHDRFEAELKSTNTIVGLVRHSSSGILLSTEGGLVDDLGWHLLAWVFDPAVGITGWKDAVPVAFVPASAYVWPTPPATLTRFMIGSRAFNGTGAPFAGRLKAMSVYSGALTQGEIDAIYADATFGMGGGPAPSLAAANLDGGMTPMDGGY